MVDEVKDRPSCMDCLNWSEGCSLTKLMPPPRFHDGWCDHYEGFLPDGELRVEKDRFKKND